MKKTIFMAMFALGLTATLLSAIDVIPSSGIVNIGTPIGFQTKCYDYYSTDTWYWGDGQTFKCQSDYPASNVLYHNYRNPGKYTVHVNRSIGASCPIDEFKEVTVLENRSIVASPAQPTVGQLVRFTANNFKTPSNVTWDMGDGTTYAHTKNVVSHTYTKSGGFTVKAYDWEGDIQTAPVTLILVLARGITYSPTLPRVDQAVNINAVGFRSESIDWNFGDGTSPQTLSAAVTHRYQMAGTFTITAVEHGLDAPRESKAITILPDNRSLVLSASEIQKDQPVTVTAINFRGPLIRWKFGDGTNLMGSFTMSHAYKQAGRYVISARDESGASEKRFEIPVTVLGISDQVNLEVAEITLDNGKYYKIIPKNSKDIRAQLKLKLRGTGIVSGYWIVDSQPFHFFNETVYQGQIRTIYTPDIPGLPVFDPGMHTITMQLTRPEGEAVVFPVLRYFVLAHENTIATLSPKDGAVIKEDEIANFAWNEARGASYYQIAFSNSLLPLFHNDAALKWRDCPDRLNFIPDAGTWGSIQRNQWTYWKVRATDSSGNTLAESDVQEIKVIIQGAEIGIQKITDMDGNLLVIGSTHAAIHAEQVLIHGSLTYPGDAEYLILQVFANDSKIDQLLFRDVKKDEKRLFETSIPSMEQENLIVFQVLKSSSPSVIIGYLELKLKKE